MPKNKCIVNDVLLKSDEYECPVLVNFQHCGVKSNGVLGMEFVTAMAISKKKSHANKEEQSNRIAIVVNKDNVYTGDITQSHLMKSYIGIKNKKTNKMNIVELEECSMISHVYDPPEEETQIVIHNARKILLKSYGSKNASRAMDRDDRMKINVDIIEEQLNSAVNTNAHLVNGKLDKFDESQLESEQFLRSILPPLNVDARKVDDVYRVDILIDETLLNRLNDEANQILFTSIEDLPIESEYIRNVIMSIQRQRIKQDPESKSSQSIDNLTKIKICIYLDALSNFSKLLNDRSLKTKHTASFSDITEKVENDIRQKFAHPLNGKIIKSNLTLRKVHYYIIVLILLISEHYETHADNVIQLTNITKTSLQKYANAVKAVYKSNTHMIALSLPSKVKEMKLFIRSKRK